jgi:hypothetical protein
VIHAALLEAVQVQPAAAVTLILPLVPVATAFVDVGEMVGEHGRPAWFTVNTDPAMVNVPVRADEAEFAATLNVTVPEPMDDAPLVTVIHEALLTACHEHPVATVTVVLPGPPAAAIDCAAGEMLGVHPPLIANVFERVLAVLPPGPIDSTTAS